MPKQKKTAEDDPMDSFENLSLIEQPPEKKDKKAKKKGTDEEEEYLESADGTVPKLTKEEVAGLNREDIKFKLTNIEQKQLSSRTDINMHIIQDYKAKV
ncbi:unnamed protein product [Cylicostephanus goldi]|uniref:Uncharacterized protein n=1 Tax=Cylicostephanus goldi TaxID=71465 RepID=A0A3P6THS3_CYLGO|nr:unnamed protein product [Cylicostephanus goldi]